MRDPWESDSGASDPWEAGNAAGPRGIGAPEELSTIEKLAAKLPALVS